MHSRRCSCVCFCCRCCRPLIILASFAVLFSFSSIRSLTVSKWYRQGNIHRFSFGHCLRSRCRQNVYSQPLSSQRVLVYVLVFSIDFLPRCELRRVRFKSITEPQFQNSLVVNGFLSSCTFYISIHMPRETKPSLFMFFGDGMAVTFSIAHSRK